jgi:NAD(P)-dependent dehydrogenase (short-subunit alcohol dehydrogenase family)
MEQTQNISTSDPLAGSRQKRVWFITGASSGLGQALATGVLEAGDSVIATARRSEALLPLIIKYQEQVRAFDLDLTQPESIRSAVQKGREAFGRIDVLVNNAGSTFLGAIEETDAAESRHVFETNFFGALAVLQEILPIMRGQKSGHILTVSSLGGFMGVPGSGLFNAAKFASEGLSEALAKEAEPLGIKVTIIEPGGFRTEAGKSLAQASCHIEDYDSTSGKTIQWIKDYAEKAPGDPEKAAAAMMLVVASASPPLRLVLGSDALKMVRTKLQMMTDEVSAWESVSVSTDFERLDT